MNTKNIKVCGMRDADNIREVMKLHPDYLGFIFYPPSERYVIELDEKLLHSLQKVKKTAVFVNADPAEIQSKIALYKFDAIQLHGSESPDFCRDMKNEGVEVIKAFGIHEAFDWEVLRPYLPHVDYFLFDTQTPIYGGSGKSFDWSVLERYPFDKKYFLSGGIDGDNFDAAYALSDDRLYGLDLNSRFEHSPGIKNIQLLSTVLKRG